MKASQPVIVGTLALALGLGAAAHAAEVADKTAVGAEDAAAFEALVARKRVAEGMAEPATPAVVDAGPGYETSAGSATGADACVTIGGGRPDILVEGAAAAAAGDGTCYPLIDGSPDVSFGGRPAVTEGMRVACPDGRVGVIRGGSSTVFVNGRGVVTADARVDGCD